MNAQQVMAEARGAHLRELREENARLKAENARLRDENAALGHHLDLAVLAAADLASLGPDGRLVIWDGWNLIFGANREARSLDELLADARKHLKEHPADFVWIVLDGHRADSRCEGRIRVTYTGGTGPHRADRLVCDYVRMAALRGDRSRIEVRTRDRDFLRTVRHLQEG